MRYLIKNISHFLVNFFILLLFALLMEYSVGTPSLGMCDKIPRTSGARGTAMWDTFATRSQNAGQDHPPAIRAEQIEIFLVMTIIVSWFDHKYFSPTQTWSNHSQGTTKLNQTIF